jgi:hypothetical protein
VPGYYIVDVPGGENYKVVFCNFRAGTSDGQFQVDTEVKFAEFPVAFDFSRNAKYTAVNSVIPYVTANVNVGGGMTLEGTFTAPLDGVYAFSFFFDENISVSSDTRVEIRVDGNVVVDSINVDQGSDATSGSTFIVRLTKGQQVDAFLKVGGIGNSADTHFAGHLIFPL